MILCPEVSIHKIFTVAAENTTTIFFSSLFLDDDSYHGRIVRLKTRLYIFSKDNSEVKSSFFFPCKLLCLSFIIQSLEIPSTRSCVRITNKHKKTGGIIPKQPCSAEAECIFLRLTPTLCHFPKALAQNITSASKDVK